ncbi:hypothetical protein Ae263Ps1_0656c [Pseudonocardia sp. Ae263_Ps1]|nr:hypothetical protein Ae150APs1_4662 [Pseudonocardia sp. Ae150A_Ps1]OLL83601.1 hypothetical protein Ae263Ps1_0656c [Pseudonocardia sp. Ae263_Ps1]OLL90359.1 hypothetical protein Ae356Ps1_0256 [Pseudonocardia sp. Ae356_Ps1]
MEATGVTTAARPRGREKARDRMVAGLLVTVRRQGLEPRTRWLRASCSAN